MWQSYNGPMTFIKRRVKFLGRSPLTIVELIIGLAAVVGGLYVVSPFLELTVAVGTAPPYVQALASQPAILVLGALALINGIAIIYGIFAKNYTVRSIALFSNICLRLFTILAVIAAQGPLPLTGWLNSFWLLLISIVCWVVVRGLVIRRIKP
jgi:hypothetical protein